MPAIRRASLVKATSPDIQKLPKCLEGMNVKVVRTVQNTPKHVSISYDANDNELVYETIVLFSAAAAFLTQLLHIYRTVWWLPQSYQYTAVVGLTYHNSNKAYTALLLLYRNSI